jgi:hypothetical protein
MDFAIGLCLSALFLLVVLLLGCYWNVLVGVNKTLAINHLQSNVPVAEA